MSPGSRVKHGMTCVVALLISIMVLIPVTVTTPAGSQPAPPAPDSRGLTVFPPNTQLEGVPGQRIERAVAIENSSATTQRVATSVRNFKPHGEDGQAAPTDEDSSYSMARWMSVSPAVVTLAPSERGEFSVVIQVPPDAEPGSHFGSAIFTPSVPDGASGTFQTITEVASLMLLRLPGPTNEAASVTSFDADVTGDNRGPVDFVTRLSNAGTVHFNPVGQVVVLDTFGREVATLPVNNESRPVLPGAVRRFDTRWDTGTLIGRYKAKLNLTYAANVPGDPDRKLTATTTFYVFPPIVLALAGVVLALMIFWIVRAVRRRKKRRATSAGS